LLQLLLLLLLLLVVVVVVVVAQHIFHVSRFRVNVTSMSFLKIRYDVQSMKLYCCKDFRKHELISGQMDKYVDEQSYVRKEERQLILWPN
jgi:uncharacterized FlgJ-related protein